MRDERRKTTGIVANDVFCVMVQFMASGEFCLMVQFMVSGQFCHEWY